MPVLNKTMLVTAGVTIGILWAVKKFVPAYYPL